MTGNACTRREFLKKFSLLSGIAAMMSAMTIACPGQDATALPSVIGMYVYDSNLNRFDLRGNQFVPVHPRFVFSFSTDMDPNLQKTAVSFVDSNNSPVAFLQAWDDGRTLSVVPSADLAFNADYVISVVRAEDWLGNGLNPYANASASFRTASV